MTIFWNFYNRFVASELYVYVDFATQISPEASLHSRPFLSLFDYFHENRAPLNYKFNSITYIT